MNICEYVCDKCVTPSLFKARLVRKNLADLVGWGKGEGGRGEVTIISPPLIGVVLENKQLQKGESKAYITEMPTLPLLAGDLAFLPRLPLLHFDT